MRSARRWTAVVLGVLLLIAVCVYTTGWWAWARHPSIVPVDSTASHAQRPAARATTPAGKPEPKDSVANDANGRLVEAYLFFFAALNSHRARGAMNTSGGLGHGAHPTTAAPPTEP